MWLLACIGLVALALLPAPTALARVTANDPPPGIAPPFSPLLAESSSDTSVAVGLTVARTDPVRPTLDLRGRSIDRNEPEAYKVDTHVSRLPCPGEYRFHAGTEDTSNGNSSSYSALLRLFDGSTRPAGARCGSKPPPLPGRMSIRLQDQVNRLFVIKGGRSNGGAFEGSLSLSSLPACDKTYTLEATLALKDWSRSAEFKVRAIEIHSTLQRRPVEDKRC
ncbi:MAG TPA: hypothetical protein VFM94_08105 [Solirubrobacterales bacterium]|nr:hypothetical protein [Solirubrobacterales bacterium]